MPSAPVVVAGLRAAIDTSPAILAGDSEGRWPLYLALVILKAQRAAPLLCGLRS